MMNIKLRRLGIKLLTEVFQDVIAHGELRIIRDTQAPRFEALRITHPKIYEDFMKARTGPHEILLKNRLSRIRDLMDVIEGKYDEDGLLPVEQYPHQFRDEAILNILESK